VIESDLNWLIVKSINASGGFAEKLKDPSYSELMRGARKVAYDYFGTLNNGQSIDGESKLIKPSTTTQLLSSFAFSKIEDHQIANLSKQVDIRERTQNNAIIVYSIGYWIPRKLKIVFFFDAKFIHDLINTKKTSISGKEMMKFYDEGKYLTIMSDYLPVSEIPNYIIKEL